MKVSFCTLSSRSIIKIASYRQKNHGFFFTEAQLSSFIYEKLNINQVSICYIQPSFAFISNAWKARFLNPILISVLIEKFLCLKN